MEEVSLTTLLNCILFMNLLPDNKFYLFELLLHDNNDSNNDDGEGDLPGPLLRTNCSFRNLRVQCFKLGFPCFHSLSVKINFVLFSQILLLWSSSHIRRGCAER